MIVFIQFFMVEGFGRGEVEMGGKSWIKIGSLWSPALA